ncbi:ABC transporter substrate-binding protein [bacterium]|nr:ABC transporter substrate-binding protein [bacterium]
MTLNRRQIMASGLALGTASLGAGRVLAADGDPIRIGFMSPRTGPLAGFGVTDGYVLDQVRAALKGGLTIGGKTYAVEILDRDTQSDPGLASQLAKDLINNGGIDMMLATSTPEVVNPASDACEAAGVPCLSTVVPWEAWYFGRGAKPGAPSPFKWTYHFSFGVDTFKKTYLSQWAQLETNKKVAVMYPNDADGNAIRAGLAPLLAAGGYTIVDPGPYETGTSDYSTQIAMFRDAGCEIFNTFPIPPDFAAFWQQAAQQGLHKQLKIVQVAKTGLFPGDIEALGSLGANIASADYWHRDFPYPSTATGIKAADLADGYEAATGMQWTQQLGATMALFDAGIEALKAASDPKGKAALAAAYAKLNVVTMVGKVDFTSGPVANVSVAPIIGSQWVKSESGKFTYDTVITENATDPNVPVTHKLLPYNA